MICLCVWSCDMFQRLSNVNKTIVKRFDLLVTADSVELYLVNFLDAYRLIPFLKANEMPDHKTEHFACRNNDKNSLGQFHPSTLLWKSTCDFQTRIAFQLSIQCKVSYVIQYTVCFITCVIHSNHSLTAVLR